MENKKDIGTAFKEKLDHLDKIPSANLWRSIEKELDKKKKKRALFWFFPALILLGLMMFLFFNNQFSQDKIVDFKEQLNPIKSIDDKNLKTATDTTKSNTNSTKKSKKTIATKGISRNNSETKNTLKENEIGQNKSKKRVQTRTERLVSESKKTIVYNENYEEYEVVKKYKIVVRKKVTTVKPKIVSKNKPKIKYVNKSKQNKKKLIKNKLNKTIISSKIAIVNPNEKTTLEKPKELITIEKPSIKVENDSVKKAEATLKSKKKTVLKREQHKDSTDLEETKNIEYYGSVFYGPTLFGSLNANSMINSGLTDVTNKHPITFYYGFYFKSKYQRLGLSLGFSKINLKTAYQFNQNGSIPNYKNIELNNSNSPLTVANYIASATNAELIQKISYYELTLAFYYSVAKQENKFGAEVTSGISMLTLDENKLYLSSNENEDLAIGTAKNISKINLSYNVGMAFNYKLFDKISLDFNPVLKYYFSTFNEKSESKPYSLSIQTGFTYKF
ncbi:hypothetical protein [Flavobacterium sp.]|uniref:hypothetical protein n=1 Tax=Flavobacterium sp. TaxID=239 RepID=UPI0037529044